MRYYISIIGLLLVIVSNSVHADISGTVTDADGNPIEGALVTATNESDPSDTESVYTDESGLYQIKATISGVNEESPLPFTLSQNYPNPFNPSTAIPFSLDSAGHVSLTVYNIAGQRVQTLVDGYRSAGTYTVTWDGLDSDGVSVSAGLYLYRLQCGGTTATRKMLLIDGGSETSSGAALSMNPVSAEKATVIGESLYKITVTRDGYQPCFRHGVNIIADADEIIDFVTCSSAVYEIHGIPFVSIPGGTFRMGDIQESGYLNERPVHYVTLDDFEMSIYEINNAQFVKYLNEALASDDIIVTKFWVMRTSDRKIYFALSDDSCDIQYSSGVFTVRENRDNCPAVNVSWYGAKAFSEHYGLDLPTEAEWEYACRAGTETNFYTGNGERDLKRAGWYSRNDEGRSSSVGQKEPNDFGLFDMHGNALEWCNDWYDPGYYNSSPSINPTGPESRADSRIIRGGSWDDFHVNCRSAYRYGHGPVSTSYGVGFRVVRRP